MLTRLIRNFSARRRTKDEHFTKVRVAAKPVYGGQLFADIGKMPRRAAPRRTDVITRDNYEMKRQIAEPVRQEREGRKRSPDTARIHDATLRGDT